MGRFPLSRDNSESILGETRLSYTAKQVNEMERLDDFLALGWDLQTNIVCDASTNKILVVILKL